MENLFTIQVAAKLSGIGQHTLRAWEKRYQAVVPKRSDTGRRLYTEEHIEKLQLLAELCSFGQSIGMIANCSNMELKEALKSLGKRTVPEKKGKSLLDKKQDVKDSLKNLLMALSMYKLDVISHEIQKLKLKFSERELVFKILVPLLNEVGIRVLKGELSVAQEQALSSILKFHMGQILFKSYEHKFKGEHQVLLATPEDEHNEFGSLLAGLLCSYHKLNFYHLGTNLPVDAISKAGDALKATLYVIYISNSYSRKQYLETYVERMLKRLKKGESLVILGGVKSLVEKYGANKKVQLFSGVDRLDEFLREFRLT